jgi:hypothetical protein
MEIPGRRCGLLLGSGLSITLNTGDVRDESTVVLPERI